MTKEGTKYLNKVEGSVFGGEEGVDMKAVSTRLLDSPPEGGIDSLEHFRTGEGGNSE